MKGGRDLLTKLGRMRHSPVTGWVLRGIAQTATVLHLVVHWLVFWPFSLATADSGRVIRRGTRIWDYAFSSAESGEFWIVLSALFASTLLVAIIGVARRKYVYLLVNVFPLASSLLLRWYYVANYHSYFPQ